jgi:hypothetical protein
MKTFVHFDSAGSIHAFITVDAPDGVIAMVEPAPGLLVAEADGPELASAAGNVETMRELAKAYKVEPSSSPRCRLTRSQAGS